MERDAKLEELGNKNNLLDEEKEALKKQLTRTERRQTISRGMTRTRTKLRPNESGVGAGGETGTSMAGLDAAKAEINKVKDQNSDLKEQIQALNAVNSKLTAKNEKFIADKKAALEREKEMFTPENA